MSPQPDAVSGRLVGGFLRAATALMITGLIGAIGVVDSSANPAAAGFDATVAIAPTPTGTTTPAPGITTTGKRATFGLQPATKGKPDARPSLSYQTSPGGTFTDSVALLNFGNIPLDLQVYVGNLSNSGTGSLSVASEDAKAVDAASWMQLRGVPHTVHIAAGTSRGPRAVVFPVKLAVPVNASPGDHVAAVVASLQTIGKNPKGENVRLLQRVALRIFVRVNGDIRSHYTVAKVKLSYSGTMNPFGKGHADLSYTVRNDGNVSIGVAQKIKLSGWFGSTGSVPKLADIGVLLPGNSIDVRVRIPNAWPEFRLMAKVTASALRTGASTDTLLAPTTASASAWAIPWPLLVLIVLLIALGIGLRRFARRGRRAYSGRRRS